MELSGSDQEEANGSNGHRAHEHHAHEHGHNHTQAFSTWSYETDWPMSLEVLKKAASKLPAGIYRAKGVIYSSDAPEQRAVLQVVGKRVDISLLENGESDHRGHGSSPSERPTALIRKACATGLKCASAHDAKPIVRE